MKYLPYVSIAFPIVDKCVSSHTFPLGHGVVGARVEVDQVQHVVDGLDDPQEVGLLQDGVQAIGEFPVGQDLEQSRQAEKGAVDANQQVELNK